MKSLAFAVLGCAIALGSLSAQAPRLKPAAKAWSVPRTPDGKPDLQGNWTNETLTPIERPQGVSNLILSEEEATRLERNMSARRDRLSEPSDPDRPAPPKGGDGSTGAAGNVGGYNNFWLAPGEKVARIDGVGGRRLRRSADGLVRLDRRSAQAPGGGRGRASRLRASIIGAANRLDPNAHHLVRTRGPSC